MQKETTKKIVDDPPFDHVRNVWLFSQHAPKGLVILTIQLTNAMSKNRLTITIKCKILFHCREMIEE